MKASSHYSDLALNVLVDHCIECGYDGDCLQVGDLNGDEITRAYCLECVVKVFINAVDKRDSMTRSVFAHLYPPTMVITAVIDSARSALNIPETVQ